MDNFEQNKAEKTPEYQYTPGQRAEIKHQAKVETHQKAARNAIEAVEKSGQATLMKDILISHFASHIMKDSELENDFLDRMKNEDLSLGQILEGIGERAMYNDDSLVNQINEKKITTIQMLEKIIADAFESAIARSNSREEWQKIIDVRLMFQQALGGRLADEPKRYSSPVF